MKKLLHYLTSFLIISITTGANAQSPGDLDASFGTGGIVHHFDTSGNGQCFFYAVAQQADDKLIASGRISSVYYNSFSTVRYNPDGSIDTSFGADGYAITNVSPGTGTANDEVARDVVIQPDGKILVAGHAPTHSQL